MKQPLIIGIAGGAGSGKTMLSRYLEERAQPFHVRVIAMDRYYKKERPQAVAPFHGNPFEDFNRPDALDIHRIMEDVRNEIAGGQAHLLIIEGFLLFHFTELLDLADLKIYVDCPPEERLLRRIPSFAKWGIAEEEVSAYASFVAYRHAQYVEPTKWHADMVVNGLCTHKGGEVVLEWIRTRLSRQEENRDRG
ncbi:uridine kinase family protein [Paenibacillus oleatilyticus]|uniref:Uridine kinase n=1 Tax=Paenibacillus oleatilyticus TaxID=2594886 RepID=A0ABV4UUS3_9BACL